MSLANEKIAVIGLGYVGLPVAIAFGRKLATVGFDIRTKRIDQLKKGHDETLEVIDTAVVSAASLRIETKMIPSGVKFAMIAVWSVECGGDKVIIQDANAKVNANVYRSSPWCTVCAATAMEVNEIR